MIDLKDISQEVISILPENLSDLEKQTKDVGWIEQYMESLGLRIQGIFEKSAVDITGNDPNVEDFRHIMRNMACRVENNLYKPDETYFWIDVFWRNIKHFFIDIDISSK